MLKRPGSLRLAERIQELLRERGRSKRSLIYQLRTRHVSTGYRVLAGTTTDPWISSILEICQALDVDPDELLQVSRQPLTNELAMLLERTEQLDEEDRWLIVDLIRNLAR